MLRLARKFSRGFSLVELLAVTGIVAILLTILLPLLARARRQAQITQCAANIRQIVLAMSTYAVQNHGQYPTLDMPATGANLWDVPHSFYDALIAQGLKHETFFCPATQDTSPMEDSFNYYGYFYILDYNIWIPRLNGPDVIPPSNTYSGTRFVLVQPPPAAPFAGPARMWDKIGSVNPMISDIAGSDAAATPPANADATAAGNPYFITSVTNHQEGGRLVGINLGFADGHVALEPASEVKPYYLGNWWNWH